MTTIRSVGRSIVMAFSMFSRIPMPLIEWKEENMRWMLCAFPLVGAVVGFMIWLWSIVAGLLHVNVLILSVGVTLAPLIIVGGIHLDGYADTLDALASCAEPERKRAILKDPHTGAFAVIGLCGYFLAMFALDTQLVMLPNWIGVMTLIHASSRCISGLATLVFPHEAKEGLLHTFRANADQHIAVWILCVEWLLCVVLLLVVDGMVGAMMPIASLLVAMYVYRMSIKQFGRMSGDIAGYLLQISELAMLAVFVMLKGVALG